MTTYTIQQRTQYQYEPIQEGDFDSAEAAISAMHELENNLGWRNLRIVKDDAVIECGLESDDESGDE